MVEEQKLSSMNLVNKSLDIKEVYMQKNKKRGRALRTKKKARTTEKYGKTGRKRAIKKQFAAPAQVPVLVFPIVGLEWELEPPPQVLSSTSSLSSPCPFPVLLIF
jgi:hypothetical protein